MVETPVIIISMNMAPVGGVAADALKCIRALRAKGRTVFALYAFMDPRTFEALPDQNVHWERLFIPKRPPVISQLLLWLMALAKVHQIKKRYPEATVICFERLPLGDVQVGTAPNSLWMEAREKMGRSKWSKIPYRLWCAVVDRIIQARLTSKILIFSDRDKAALLNKGVDASRIYKAIIPTDTKRFHPNTDRDRRYVTIIGADPKLKGIDIALQAWPGVIQKFPGIKLRIVTHGWKVKKLTPRNDPSIELANFKPEVEDYYHSSRLVIMPSMFETWGNVVPESLACGVPVVASSDVPSSEMITEPYLGVVMQRDGIHDGERLSEAICQALDLPMQENDLQERHQHVIRYMQSNSNIVSWITHFESKGNP